MALTEQQKVARELQELAELKAKSMYSVPLNPSDAGLSPQEIKEHMYGGNFFNYRLIKNLRDNVEQMEVDLDYIKENGSAKYDHEMNVITETYATKEEFDEGILSLSEAVDAAVPQDLSDLLTIDNMSESGQSQAYIYIDNNGTPAKIAMNKLNFSKITRVAKNVSEENEMSNVRINDFIFKEE